MERPTAQIFNSSMVLVSWKPPYNPGGPLNYYEVTAIKVDGDSERNETHVYNTTGMKRSQVTRDLQHIHICGLFFLFLSLWMLDGMMTLAWAVSFATLDLISS
jgi:hypothetical protein